MKFFIFSTLRLILSTGSAHETFGNLVVNGTVTPKWKYVRDVAGEPYWATQPNVDPEYAKRYPFFDLFSPWMTCGRDAYKSAMTTETASVIAGSELGMWVSNVWNSSNLIFHDGPGQVYMSRAPNDDLEHYDGKGDWFKIATVGVKSDTAWQLRWTLGPNFTIPATTPPGHYLLRVEHFQPSRLTNTSQWYVNCAHINVIGPGGGMPTGSAKFPGAYDLEDPGIHVEDRMDMITPVQGVKIDLSGYVAPGPPVWKG
ncbi:lytic polysaccharide monooxygenase [Zopfia rhizophila CBS 207.26]|uniref:lytic cellulose monooxygenase (C4-dehydrogenating) n=1 Tax=Zopfia rhizophila CBS 207.26 TaxID=1314779 RepID=A0A6A6DKT1_9PEZI|nr:lytic polysaccharide monooxygenase [Zopfia rhizophila CBS 207.26]